MASDAVDSDNKNPLEPQALPELAAVIRSQTKQILQRWDAATRLVPQTISDLNLEEMRDHLPEILALLADLLEEPTAQRMQFLVESTALHGIARFHQRYALPQLMSEGRLLRRVIVEQVEVALSRQKTPAESIGLHTGIDIILHGGFLSLANEWSEELRHARQEAEAANRAKDEFLAALSHELRTPLTPILFTISLLEERRDLPPDTRADIETIRRSVELEARLIDDLLDLTRIARGKLQLDITPVDMHLVIRRAYDMCCKGQPQRISLELNAPQHHVHADPARLQQVFWNLLNNAVKFTPPEGDIRVRTSNADGEVRVEVIDTGVGIEAELVPKLFTAFEQGGEGTTRRFGGLGLGLTISKRLMDLQNGSLIAQSAGKGKGATFTVGMSVAPVPAQRPDDGSIAGPPEPEQRPLAILLVEDNESTLRALARLLESMGHRVRIASTAELALAAAQQERFDLLISDLGLPDKNGHELMRMLREHSSMPGIALSGFGMEADIRSSEEAGFAAHLTKPVDLQLLAATIRRVQPG